MYIKQFFKKNCSCMNLYSSLLLYLQISCNYLLKSIIFHTFLKFVSKLEQMTADFFTILAN